MTVRVAIVDSGWDRSIPEPRVKQGVAFVDPANDFAMLESDDDHDRIGHGTSVSDIVLQVAPAAEIVPVRVFGRRLDTSPSTLLTSIEWVTDQGFRVVNLSLACCRTDWARDLYRACERACASGTLIVAASGIEPEMPASFEPVIGVTGHTSAADRFRVWYDEDSAIECAAAPRQRARGLGGRQVVSTGSSASAPVVTGHIARYLESAPGADLHEVRQMLRQLSDTHSVT
jgi:subtilisin family serine protease